MTIAIVDYGVGNLTSVSNALDSLGLQNAVIKKPETLYEFQKIILPGVGAFGHAMSNLKETGFDIALKDMVHLSGASVLGICLGMHLLSHCSHEFGFCEGLSLIPGTVTQLKSAEYGELVPHVGWTDVHLDTESELFAGMPHETCFYHVHSFQFIPEEGSEVLATFTHGHDVVASVKNGNVYGVQFHPEKSQKYGLQVLKNFSMIA